MMGKRRRWIGMVGLALAIILVAAACGGGGGGGGGGTSSGSVQKGMDGKAPAPKPISGIETPDDSTIIFNLTKPVGDFLYRVSMPATAPIPQEVAKCFTKAGDYGRYVISSGPYMLKGSET